MDKDTLYEKISSLDDPDPRVAQALAVGAVSSGAPEGRDGGTKVAEGRLLVGDASDERIEGRGGDDELYGGHGDDLVSGGEGDDYLAGNYGGDILVGGAGRDTFSFDGDFDREVVADFTVGEDRLEFILYPPKQLAATAAELLDMFVQVGGNARLSFAGTDERITLLDVELGDLRADMISVRIVPPEFDLLA